MAKNDLLKIDQNISKLIKEEIGDQTWVETCSSCKGYGGLYLSNDYEKKCENCDGTGEIAYEY